MRYLDFLQGLHAALEPPTYLEIGIRHGDSLALATGPSVGIDPAYELRVELPAEPALFRETSDEYFDRERPLEPLGDRPAAFAFIDGLHLVEYALRDFINVERHSDWTSVVVFDDIFPADAEMAARNRRTRLWTGDVYKILAILDRQRRDLVCIRVDTEPSGLLLVLGLDPASRVLDERYDELVLEAVRPDPQRVPDDVLRREGAVDPETVLSATFWSLLREGRADGRPRSRGMRELRRRVRHDLGPAVKRQRAVALAR